MAEVNDRKMAASECSICTSVSRRDFVKAVSAGAFAGAVPLFGRSAAAGPAQVGPSPSAAAETTVARFYKTITPEQRKLICFPFDHPLRKRVGNNWAIVKPTIDDLSSDQKALCQEIMKNLCSEDGYERFTKQMDDDAGGFENYHVAVFGEPGTDKPFEWVLTGRHDTLRADGNSVEGAAFGGPIFYGHAADGHDNEDSKHTNNVWWYQGEQANKIFRTLDDKQQAQALVAKAEADEPKTTRLKGDKLPQTGLLIAGLDGQQKAMVAPAHRKDAQSVPRVRCRGSAGVSRCQRRRRYASAHVLQGRRHRQRRRLGYLEAGRPGVLVVLPRFATRSYLVERRDQGLIKPLPNFHCSPKPTCLAPAGHVERNGVSPWNSRWRFVSCQVDPQRLSHSGRSISRRVGTAHRGQPRWAVPTLQKDLWGST